MLNMDTIQFVLPLHLTRLDNSLNLLAKVEFESEIGQEGMIECIVKESCLNDKTDLLFEHFKLTMEMIKGQYPKNIKILKKQGVTPYVKHELTVTCI